MLLLKHKYSPLVLCLLLGLFMLWFYTGYLWSRLDTVLFAANGDGIKNYYTAAYHLKYDSDIWHFSGMNYPQGDQVMFTDGYFPVVAVLWIIKPIVDLSDHMVLIINLTMLLSVIAAVFFLYKVFREFEINAWLVALIAPGIIFLFPGLQRFPGHYSLSWVFFIPLLFYLLIRFSKQPRLKYIIITGFVVLWFSLLHLYYFAIAGLLIGIYVLYMVWAKNSSITLKKGGALLLGAVIIPYLLIFLMMYFTDQVNDRSTYPYGFFVCKSAWEGVFLPLGNKFYFGFMNSWFRPDTVEWEGCNFIGNTASWSHIFVYGPFASLPFLFHKSLALFIVTLVFSFVVFFFLKRKYRWHDLSGGNYTLNAFLWAGMVALLLSFALPMSVFPGLYYKLGPMREIRGIGRLNWVFFFAANVAAFCFIIKKIKISWLKIPLLIVAIAFTFFDGYKANKDTLRNLGRQEEFLKVSADLGKSPLNDPEFCRKYQALVSVPFIMVGSENISYYSNDDELLAISLLASWNSGIPLVSSMLSRTSISQSVERAELLMGPYNHEKKWFDRITDTRPFLILTYRHNRELLPGEQSLMASADTIYNSGQLILASITPAAWKKILSPVLPAVDSLNTDSVLFYESFDSLGTTDGYYDKGAFHCGPLKEPIRILEKPLNRFTDTSETYELSFWFSDIDEDALSRGTIEVVLLDQHDSVVYYEYPNIGQSVRQIDGHWAQFVFLIKASKPSAKLRLSVLHYELKHNYFTIDRVMLKPMGRDVGAVSGKYIMFNNLYYSRKL